MAGQRARRRRRVDARYRVWPPSEPEAVVSTVDDALGENGPDRFDGRGEERRLVRIGKHGGVIGGREGAGESRRKRVPEQPLVMRHVVIARIADVACALVVEL